MRALHAVDTHIVASLLTSNEVHELDLSGEAALCAANGIEFISLPVRDRAVPVSQRGVQQTVQQLAHQLDAGRNIVIHCRMGIGHAALLAACVLAYLSVSVDDAFETIAQARGCPVPDTSEQRAWVTQVMSRARAEPV